MKNLKMAVAFTQITPNRLNGSQISKYRKYFANWFLPLCAIYYLFLLYYNCTHIFNNLDKMTHAGIPDIKNAFRKCISFLNCILQVVVYFSININNILTYLLTTESPLVKNVVLPYEKILAKNFLSVVFPLSWSVCTLFWYVYYLDRELIYPKEVEDLFAPAWYNHSLHTMPVLIVLLHLALVQPKYTPLPMTTAMVVQCTIHALYLVM
ncbi:hypothetical protein M8J76_013103 [Diaphorina citri]|nr:hypothetical protein M8J75_011162 [Diaphorina citri]KAI5750135.1 hypothetical protein M8J76_013103 [Diaphorina citri]